MIQTSDMLSAYDTKCLQTPKAQLRQPIWQSFQQAGGEHIECRAGLSGSFTKLNTCVQENAPRQLSNNRQAVQEISKKIVSQLTALREQEAVLAGPFMLCVMLAVLRSMQTELLAENQLKLSRAFIAPFVEEELSNSCINFSQ